MKTNKVPKFFVLGLTGIYGSGKTTVRKLFEANGFKGIDTDSLAKTFWNNLRFNPHSKADTERLV